MLRVARLSRFLDKLGMTPLRLPDSNGHPELVEGSGN
jgi:hypothetical protein